MNEIDEIRQQMAQLRHGLHQDVSAAVSPAVRMFDWRMYAGQAPWLAVGLSFAVGYILVPRKAWPAPPMPPPSPSDDRPLYRAEAAPRPASRGLSVWSLLRWGLGFAGPLAMQAVQSYAATWIEDLLLKQRGIGLGPLGEPAGPAGAPAGSRPVGNGPDGGPSATPPWARRVEDEYGDQHSRFG